MMDRLLSHRVVAQGLALLWRLPRINPLGWLLAVLLALAVVLLVWQWALRPMLAMATLDWQRAEAAVQNQAITSASLRNEGSASNLQVFMDNLGDPRHLEQQLKTLFVIAADLSLQIAQANYKLQCDEGADFCVYRIDLPLQGEYAQIRALVEQTLQAIPFASVEEMSLRRESISDTEVQTRLKLNLYTRVPSAQLGAGRVDARLDSAARAGSSQSGTVQGAQR